MSERKIFKTGNQYPILLLILFTLMLLFLAGFENGRSAVKTPDPVPVMQNEPGTNAATKEDFMEW